jgi:hypothetical protein
MEWVNVNDQMPGEYERVLVAEEHWNGWKYKIAYYTDRDEMWHGASNVSHWGELPEPPDAS